MSLPYHVKHTFFDSQQLIAKIFVQPCIRVKTTLCSKIEEHQLTDIRENAVRIKNLKKTLRYNSQTLSL